MENAFKGLVKMITLCIACVLLKYLEVPVKIIGTMAIVGAMMIISNID